MKRMALKTTRFGRSAKVQRMVGVTFLLPVLCDSDDDDEAVNIADKIMVDMVGMVDVLGMSYVAVPKPDA